MAEATKAKEEAPTWKKVLAFIVDLLVSFLVLGYLVAAMTGGLTSDGFSLEGGPAFLVFALVVLYFVLMNKFVGGTLGKMLFGIKKK
jgi:uncharacterized RDD family membrane protein YckC